MAKRVVSKNSLVIIIIALVAIIIGFTAVTLFAIRQKNEVVDRSCDLGARGTSPMLSSDAKASVEAAYADYEKQARCNDDSSATAALKNYSTDSFAKSLGSQKSSRAKLFCTTKKIADYTFEKDSEDPDVVYVNTQIAGSSVGPRVKIVTKTESSSDRKIAGTECENGVAG